MRSKYAARVCGANIELFINEGCRQFVLPKTNTAFWQAKIARNRERDRRNYDILLQNGWQVIVLWECQLQAKQIENTMQQTAIALNHNYLQIVKMKAQRRKKTANRSLHHETEIK